MKNSGNDTENPSRSAFAAVSGDPVFASAAGLAAFGIAGEKAVLHSRGPYSFKTALFDELAALTPEDLASCAKIRKKYLLSSEVRFIRHYR